MKSSKVLSCAFVGVGSSTAAASQDPLRRPLLIGLALGGIQTRAKARLTIRTNGVPRS
jgi:hypothetical protein